MVALLVPLVLFVPLVLLPLPLPPKTPHISNNLYPQQKKLKNLVLIFSQLKIKSYLCSGEKGAFAKLIAK